MPNKARSRRYFIRTFGCQMNFHDSEKLAGALDELGMESARNEEEADLVVFNTCCVRENADNKLYGNLGALKRVKEQKKDFRIAVGGCLAQKVGAGIAERADHVDIVFGTHNLEEAGSLIERQWQRGGRVIAIRDEPSPLTVTSVQQGKRERLASAWVTIATGCDNTCTFCIVPSVRGKERSRPLEEIVSEIEQLAEDGVVEVTLLGQNVNSYGRDLHEGGRAPLFSRLLTEISQINGIRRIRFTSPHPKDLREDVIDVMASVPQVMPHLHLPLQSGSDRVLAAMHRGYTSSRYLERVYEARNAVDGIAISTDLIVGFPGESDVDFQKTLGVVAQAEFDDAYSFIYSPREGTPAATMPNQVPPEVANERYLQLTELLNELALRSNRRRLGRIEEILIEGYSKKNGQMLTGRTPHNRLVHIPNDFDLREGDFVDVKITHAAPHFLLGETLSEESPATR